MHRSEGPEREDISRLCLLCVSRVSCIVPLTCTSCSGLSAGLSRCAASKPLRRHDLRDATSARLPPLIPWPAAVACYLLLYGTLLDDVGIPSLCCAVLQRSVPAEEVVS